jgi:competence protein CoiA
MERKPLSLHKAVQEHVISLLPPGQALLEHPFPGRFADVAWPEMKIIFEIQCSPISPKEVAKRIDDYQSFGYRVIWILHQKTFNKRLVARSEMYLRTHRMALFTNITIAGQGSIYDQQETIKGMIRTYRSLPLSVDLKRPIFQKPSPKKRGLNLLFLYDKWLFKIVEALNG